MMSNRDWAFLACRVLALYVLYLGFKSLMYSANALLLWLTSGSGTFTPGFSIYFVGFEVVAFLFFWCGASWLSKIMAPAKAADQDFDTRYVAQLMTLCISVFGLILVVNAIPGFIGVLASNYVDAKPYLIGAITRFTVEITVGLLLIIGAERLSDIIKRLRSW